MTKEKVLELAKVVASAEMLISELGQMNTPAEPEKRIESQARYRMSLDALDAKRAEYRIAFEAWKAQGFPGL